MGRIVRIPEWAIAAVRSSGAKFNSLVIAEDWCGDRSSMIPYLARLATLTRNIELRVLRRDEHPVVMDQYLTHGARARPIVIVLNPRFEELGYWGPRPRALREWALREREQTGMKPPYPQIRRWYARDKGESTFAGGAGAAYSGGVLGCRSSVTANDARMRTTDHRRPTTQLSVAPRTPKEELMPV